MSRLGRMLVWWVIHRETVLELRVDAHHSSCLLRYTTQDQKQIACDSEQTIRELDLC
ncbi:hypothetical protein D3C76_1571280 [compost metagenome]